MFLARVTPSFYRRLIVNQLQNKKSGRNSGNSELSDSVPKKATAAMSLQEIADLFGVSPQAVYQVEKSAMVKIRREIRRMARKRGVSVKRWLRSDDA